MQASVTTSIGKIDIYDYYVIAVVNEGVLLGPEHNQLLVNIAKDYFEDTLFGYITYRVNSYSVDPNIYLKTSEIKNLIGFAIITNKKITKNNVAVERLFLKKPMETFQTIKEAKIWLQSLIAKTSTLL